MIALPDGFGLTVPAAAVATVVACVWGSAFLAWAAPLDAARIGRLAAAAGVGAALFGLAVFAVQVPLQSAAGAAIGGDLSPFWLGAHLWFAPLLLALVAAACQELGRLAAVALGVRLAAGRVGAPALGVAAGFGVGLFEAAMILGALPPGQLHLVSLAVLERVGAVAFHVGAGGLLGLGIARRRTGAALAIAIVLHAVVDGLAALYGVHLVSLALVEAANLAVGVGLLAAVQLGGRPPTRADLTVAAPAV